MEDGQNLYCENHLHLLQNDDITLDPHTEENYVVARAFVDVQRGVVPVKILNPMEDDIIIPVGTVVASCQLVLAVLGMCDEPTLQNASVHVISEETSSNPMKAGSYMHLAGLLQNCRDLNEEEREHVQKLLIRYADIFARDDSELGRTNWTYHRKNAGNFAAIQLRPRRMAPHQHEEIARHTEAMLCKGIIEESNNPWSAPVVLVYKQCGST